MEIKKIREADLERGRLTWFLMGLTLALAALFVAFEYTDSAGLNDLGEAMDEEEPLDVELIPLTDTRPMVEMARPKAVEAPKKIEVVGDDATASKAQELTAEATIGPDSAALNPSASIDEIALPEIFPTANPDNPLNFRVAEELPQFPGGPVELMKWLTRNLRYPSAAERQRVEGKVVVQFMVNTDGSVSNIKVVQPLHALCDREATRVVRMMPKWKPGIQNDKPCRTVVCIPIVFKLS